LGQRCRPGHRRRRRPLPGPSPPAHRSGAHRARPGRGPQPAVRLDGKVIALTGGGGLLGRTLAARFATEGAAAIVLADLDAAVLDEVAASFEHNGAKVTTMTADVTDPAAVDRIVDRTVADHGRLDVMI